MAEHSAVNRRVVSSSLTCGANQIGRLRASQMMSVFFKPLGYLLFIPYIPQDVQVSNPKPNE